MGCVPPRAQAARMSSTSPPGTRSSPPRARSRRLPASVEKIYTTSTALLRFGATGTLTTKVLGSGSLDAVGGWHGTLYLRGGGDPTFGSASYDRFAYGAGATMQRLVANLIARVGHHVRPRLDRR